MRKAEEKVVSMPERAPQKTVGIWIRVSTEDQAKGESPEHHEARARMYAQSRGWEVVRLYDLAGFSGKSVMGHPEAKAMMDDVRSGRITGLIFSKLARFARNTRELLDLADFFREQAADLVSLQESIDTSTPAGRLFYTMLAGMAQWEREETSDRVSASVKIRATLGKSLGGAAPFGFRWENRRLVPEPSEVPIVRRMFELFRQHRRLKTVARLLNESGLRTRSGAAFSDTTVRRLISDPAMKGLRRANYTKSTGDKKHWTIKPKSDWIFFGVEPLVPEELWDECNASLAARATGPKPAKRGAHLFTGVTFCQCGQKMYVPSNTPKYVCYRCRTKIPVQDLERVFREELKNFFYSPEDVANYLAEGDRVLSGKQDLLAAYEKETSQVRDEMEKVYRLYLADQISPGGFGERNRPLEARLRALEAEIPKLLGEMDFLRVRHLSGADIVSGAQDLFSRWSDLPFEERREIVETIVNRITVGKDEISFDLSYSPTPPPPSPKTPVDKQRNFIPALPFCQKVIRALRQRELFTQGHSDSFGRTLKRLRLVLGHTQDQAGALLAVSGQTVRYWEQGRAKPGSANLTKLLNYLREA